MKIATIDSETTTFKKGNPFARRNLLCLFGIETWTLGCAEKHIEIFDIEYNNQPYNEKIARIKHLVEEADLLVGFNLKFDLNWIRRYVPDIKFPRVWDCQLSHFIDMGQSNPYPSLNDVAAYYSLPPKLDVVRSEYWENGIDTPDIPYSVLKEYLEGDLSLTSEIFKRQYDNPERKGLKELHNEDLLNLAACECSGLPFEFSRMESKLQERKMELLGLESNIRRVFKIESKGQINLLSPEQFSILLYGGRLYRRDKVQYERELKSGTVIREKLGWVYDVFPPRVRPPRSHELQATKGISNEEIEAENRIRLSKGLKPIQRLFSCEENVLRNLVGLSRPLKGAIKDYIRFKEIHKIIGTYYEGLQKIHDEHDWMENRLFPTYNQCVVATGRLSSSKPNAQNFPPEARELVHAKEGYYLVEADAKQLEWICCATLAKDEVALNEIKNNIDIHEVNRVQFGLPDRLIAKIFVFRLIYGGSAYSYANDPDFKSVSSKESFWQDIIDKFYSKYKGIHRWHRSLIDSAIKNNGYWESPTSRFYRFEIGKGQSIPRTKILNYPVQGFAADIMALSRAWLYRELSTGKFKGVSLLGTVHDSILLEVPIIQLQKIKNLLEEAFFAIPTLYKEFDFHGELPVGFPVKVKAGDCWVNLKEI